MQLRDYQQQAIDDIRTAFASGARRVLYVLPTGGGKTQIFTHIARGAAAKQKRIACIAHRSELISQISTRLEHPHGIIQARYTPSPWQPIQIATVQTLARRVASHNHCCNFDLLIFDEAHHCVSETYRAVADANPNAKILGVTATPMRLDGRGLGELYETIVEGPSVADLTDQGYLAPAEVYAPSTINVDAVHTERGDYVKAELSKAADKPSITGDAIKHYRKYADGLPALVSCVSRAHAEHVAAQFRVAGIAAKSVDGTTPENERKGALNALARGDLDAVMYCELFSEGVDVPVVACGIMLRPTKSLAMHLQQIGRILRPAPGKDKAIILDHAGNVNRHGLPDDPREWSLDGTPRKQSDADPVARIRQCPACYHVHRFAHTCPACGHRYAVAGRELDERDGELELVTKARPSKAKFTPEERKQRRKEEFAARTVDELRKLADERGYKPGWIYQHLQMRRQYRQPMPEGAESVLVSKDAHANAVAALKEEFPEFKARQGVSHG